MSAAQSPSADEPTRVRTIEVFGIGRIAAVADACRLRITARSDPVDALQKAAQLLEEHPVQAGSAAFGETADGKGRTLCVVFDRMADAEVARRAVEQQVSSLSSKLADWCTAASLQVAREKAAVRAMECAVRKATLVAQVGKCAIARVASVTEVQLGDEDDPIRPDTAPMVVTQKLIATFELHRANLA